MMEFSSQVWLDVIDVLRDLSVDLSCKPDGLKEIGKGNAYGIIGINNGCVYGDMRWDIKAPVLHEYTLEYEIVSDAAKPIHVHEDCCIRFLFRPDRIWV